MQLRKKAEADIQGLLIMSEETISLRKICWTLMLQAKPQDPLRPPVAPYGACVPFVKDCELIVVPAFVFQEEFDDIMQATKVRRLLVAA